MDPRTHGPQQRSANLSPLMQAKGRAYQGEKVNACPFGCKVEDLDDLANCYHLLGYTLTDNESLYEPLLPPDNRGRRIVDGSQRLPVLKTDHKERITTSHMVYRNIPRPAWAAQELDEAELEAATRP